MGWACFTGLMRLWCSSFHEAGRILVRRKRQFFVEKVDGAVDSLEQAGDMFVGDIFIPVPACRGCVQRAVVTSSTIREQGIAPDIVVSTPHHEHHDTTV